MKFYLVQHGDAVPKEENPDRHLSTRGQADVTHMASFLAAAGVRPHRMIHSGKTRARETAAILGKALCPEAPLEAAALPMAPKDGPGAMARAAHQWTADVMIVGHMPFLGRLVSLLAAGSRGAKAVGFKPGSVACLERKSDGWTIAWMVRPDLLGG